MKDFTNDFERIIIEWSRSGNENASYLAHLLNEAVKPTHQKLFSRVKELEAGLMVLRNNPDDQYYPMPKWVHHRIEKLLLTTNVVSYQNKVDDETTTQSSL